MLICHDYVASLFFDYARHRITLILLLHRYYIDIFLLLLMFFFDAYAALF